MYELVRYYRRPDPQTRLDSTPMVACPPPDRRATGPDPREILDVATSEFAEQGYSGARVDEIAARTRTTKRMLYYYFGSKEGLYVAVLERAYAQHPRAPEQAVDVEHLDPVAAIRRLAELTFDHHESHPDFIRLVEHREHPPRRAPARRSRTSPTLGSPGACERDRADPGPRPRRPASSARRRRRRRAHGDQLVLRVPDRQPAHLETLFGRDLSTRPGASTTADARRHGRRTSPRAGG